MSKKKTFNQNTNFIKHHSYIVPSKDNDIKIPQNIIQAKIFLHLLRNAQIKIDTLNTKKTFVINIKEIISSINYPIKYKQRIISVARQLINLKREYVYIKNNKEHIRMETIFNSFDISDDDIEYQLNDGTIELLKHNKSYIKYDLLELNVFKNTQGIMLYQYLLRTISSLQKAETIFFTIKDFKKLLEIKKDYSYKHIKNDFIKPILNTINTKTKLYVELEEKKSGRKVIEIKFYVMKQEVDNYLANYSKQEFIQLMKLMTKKTFYFNEEEYYFNEYQELCIVGDNYIANMTIEKKFYNNMYEKNYERILQMQMELRPYFFINSYEELNHKCKNLKCEYDDKKYICDEIKQSKQDENKFILFLKLRSTSKTQIKFVYQNNYLWTREQLLKFFGFKI